MCFETTKNARAKIAKTDIECWKVIRINNSPVYKWVHNSKIIYKKGKVMPMVTISFYKGIIEAGYHSSKTNTEMLITIASFMSCGAIDKKEMIICKFIIPVGTRYYENETEYVSETIKLIE